MNRFTRVASSLLLAAGISMPLHADEAAVRAVLDAYVEAFNGRNLDAVAGLWTENGTHIDRETGERTEGRNAIRSDIVAALKEQPDTRLAGRVDRVRFIKPDVVAVEGQTSIGPPGQEPSLSAFSGILVNQDGKWLIDSVQEMPVPQPPTSYDALRELEWLVGRWVDDSDGVRVDTTFRWTADRAFLLRSFVIQAQDGASQQGTQVIGWDPRSGQIRSWSFNSDGSFGDATWSKNGEDWLIKSSQTLSDGRAASGTYVLTRIDDNRLLLQLIGHEIEGEPQPTSPAVTVVRVEEQVQPASPQPTKQ